MLKTQLIKDLSDLIFELEINVTRSVIDPNSYEIKNGLVSNNEIDELRERVKDILKTIDSHLFNQIDDGR